jgi:hypothetical protein
MQFDDGSQTGITKREFVKKAAYAVPAVLTLAAAPSFASAGSNSNGRRTRRRPRWATANQLNRPSRD